MDKPRKDPEAWEIVLDVFSFLTITLPVIVIICWGILALVLSKVREAYFP